jgi:oxygen-independent coproporphyrinogen-3 oxidase
VRKCPYCDFNSHEARGEIPQQAYVDALVADLEQALPLIWGRKVYSVFFGGGTPSMLAALSVDSIMAAVRARVPLAVDAEITLEAHPGTFEARKFAEFRAAGINRLSIGVQSFNPRHLQALGRIHDEREARAAIAIGTETFERVNVDLMYGLPGQTRAEAAEDIETALAFAPGHISAYHLTIEPNTYFARHPPELPDDDSSADMQEQAERLLAAGGYHHYETSAFALPQRECRHNLNYWQFGDYLGIGAGAHSKLSFPDRIVRQMRYKQPKEFMARALAGAAVQQENEVAVHDLGFEFMMNALRLIDGVAMDLFVERTGLPLTEVLRDLALAEQKGLISRDHRRLVPTPLGQRFLNDLLQIFLHRKADGGGSKPSAKPIDSSGR